MKKIPNTPYVQRVDGEMYFDLSSDDRFPLKIPTNGWIPMSSKSFPKTKRTIIYLLKCKEHLYIGSDNDGNRVYNHKSSIKNKKHKNCYIQNAANKYGLEAFYYIPLIEIPEELVCKRDQIENSYIKHFDTCVLYNPIGLNIVEFASVPALGKKLTDEEIIGRCGAKSVKLIDPNGNVVEDISIRAIARKYGLSRQNVSGLIKDGTETLHTKGFRRFDEKNIGIPFDPERDYKSKRIYGNILEFEIITPTGERVKGANLNKYCKKYNLDHSAMYAVIKGKTRIYKGYKSPIYYYEIEKRNPSWDNLVQYRDDKEQLLLASKTV